MNHYELLYIVSANYTEDELSPIKDKVKETVKKNGGEISTEENLGKKKLAYPIKKIRNGYYLLVEFNLDPAGLKKLNTDLRMASEVLRHMIVVKDPRAAQTKPVWIPRTESRVVTTKEETAEKTHGETESHKSKVSLEDLDKKLDQILEGDIM